MSAADILFIAGLLLGALALALLPLPAEAEPDATDEDVKSIDYRPSVMRAVMQRGLTFADFATSPRRNAAFMTDTQQAALMPCTSEQAARHIARRMKARMPGELS